MRLFFCAVLSIVVVSQQHSPQSPATNQPTAAEQRGTQESPFVVKVTPTPKTKEEIDQDSKERDEKTSSDNWTIRLTGALVLVAFGQLIVYGYQSYKLKQTVESAGEQSQAMERHIAEAGRGATAMEKIATTIEVGNKAIMRAYLTVVVGDPIYQMRRPSQSDLKFEGRPLLMNTGNTPARKVKVRIAAGIVANPIPDDFDFPLPIADEKIGYTTVGAHQSYTMGGILQDFVPDAEVAAIKEGDGKCLCVWGLVSYEDIFGDSHTTTFGQQLTWWPSGKAYGYYIAGQNDVN